jgi:hypothetical protein
MTVIYRGTWFNGLREYRLELKDGRQTSFTVKPGQCVKAKFSEALRRLA